MTAEWWRGSTVYQIYPRSFGDANGDGLGDLRGITARLDHVAALGVDAIWVSPFYTSPMRDFGYDVADYCDVDPTFGTLDDFDALVAHAHASGLRVLVDLVLSHTSDQHPWFAASRAARDGDKADWYVWADAREDGTPPNNWLSVFGGSAWHWDTRRQQYYLHNFLVEQPDLNLHNPKVQDSLLDVARFWLDRGVDGFRLDAINFLFHDPQLRDNPPVPVAERRANLTPRCNPHAFQQHVYDSNRPEVPGFLARLREVFDAYPHTTSVAEIGGSEAYAQAGLYTGGDRHLHMAYTFSLLGESFGAAHLRREIEAQEAALGDGWMCWSFGNHDVARVRTRWGGDAAPASFARLALALLTSLRGAACLYQGDELGLPEADVPFDRLQDPYGKTFWPEYRGRDGCRTPMPWAADRPHGGFTEAAQPWLPVPEAHLALAVDRQASDPTSTLHFTRAWLAWYRSQPLLHEAGLRFVDAPEPLLVFDRDLGGRRLRLAFNLSPDRVRCDAVDGARPAGAPGASPGPDLDGFGFFVGAPT